MQFADDLNLSMASKNLARCYFDSILIAFEQVSHQSHLLLIITCLSLAAKVHPFFMQFYECQEISDKASISRMAAEIQFELSSTEIIELEKSVLEALQWRMCFTSPDDYLQIFLHRFSHGEVFKRSLP